MRALDGDRLGRKGSLRRGWGQVLNYKLKCCWTEVGGVRQFMDQFEISVSVSASSPARKGAGVIHKVGSVLIAWDRA
jgi:hypothetical protein